MKKYIILVWLMVISASIFAQAPNWLWAKSAGGTGSENALSIASNGSRNVYISGDFISKAIAFDTNTLINTDTSGNTMDIFLANYDVNGNVVWVKHAGGTNDDDASSVAVGSSKNIYISGWFSSSSLVFDSDTITNMGLSDIFLTKYDTNGNVIWAKCFGGIGTEFSGTIAIDDSENIYVAGSFKSDTITFGSFTLTNTINNNNCYDIFLIKLDSNGNVLWARSAKGPGDDEPTSITIDAIGNIYLAGFFISDTISFGSNTLTNTYHNGVFRTEIFITKYDAGGNVLWAKNAQGINDDYPSSIATDASGYVYFAGSFSSDTLHFGSATLINSITSLINPTPEDIFLAKLDSSGNIIWAKSFFGLNYDYAISLALDASGNIYLTGRFMGTLNFGNNSISNAGFINSFLAKFDNNGNDLWVKRIGGTKNDFAGSAVLDASDNIYMIGTFGSNTLAFDSINLINTSLGYYDVFLAKIGREVLTGINDVSEPINITFFPNPASENITIIIPKKATLEIITISGQILETLYSTENMVTIDVENYSKGVYIVRVKTDNEIVIKKIIKE
jgi:hypothetical protein